MNRSTDNSRSSGPTTSELRHHIDQGRMDDKVAAEDPSAAPLGTDDESAGQPPGPEQVESAMRQERAAPAARRSSTMLPWTLAVLAALMAVVVILAMA